jgi:hypothetical protein
LAEELAVPTHSAFTGGPVGDRLLVKHDGTPENFRAEAAVRAPDTRVHVLPPGQPLTV